jgi:hypothetical protein
MDEADVPSVSTLNRLISREDLFFRLGAKLHRKRSKAAVKAHERKRKPSKLNADTINKVIWRQSFQPSSVYSFLIPECPIYTENEKSA